MRERHKYKYRCGKDMLKNRIKAEVLAELSCRCDPYNCYPPKPPEKRVICRRDPEERRSDKSRREWCRRIQ
jgi:hypothetical protein